MTRYPRCPTCGRPLASPDDLEHDADEGSADFRVQAERDRARAGVDRAQAAEDRARAAADREAAARDREEARAARAEARRDLERAATDGLTGARTRTFGLGEVEREMERARRTGSSLVLAFVDVDALKEVNDTHGHLAGDALLRLVVDHLRANVRLYDVVVRYGGDEFLCAMSNITEAEARQRMDAIAEALTAGNPMHSITFGLAEHDDPAEELDELIGRADADLLAARQARASRE